MMLSSESVNSQLFTNMFSHLADKCVLPVTALPPSGNKSLLFQERQKNTFLPLC